MGGILLLLAVLIALAGHAESFVDMGNVKADEHVENLSKKTNTFGTLLLDAIVFDKVIPNLVTNTIVMIATKGCIGKQECDKVRDKYIALAKKSAKVHEVLFTQIIVNGAENMKLAQDKFGLSNPNRIKNPHFFIIKTGETTPIALQTPETVADLTIRDVTYFLKKETGVSFGLEGTNSRMDDLAGRFVSEMALEDDHVRILREARDMVSVQKEKSTGSADVNSAALKNMEMYVKVMEKILEKGNSFPTDEIKRLNSIIESEKVSESRKAEFRIRVNILSSFDPPENLVAPKPTNVAADGSEIE